MIPLTKPLFWQDPGKNRHNLSMWLIGWLLRLMLFPFAALYWLAGCLRFLTTKPYKASLPVICVGNITIGGSGKTPVCSMLYEHLKKVPHQHNPVILMRGYGGSKGIKEALLVDPDFHSVEEVGDEALMMARRGYSVVICKNRAAGAQFIEQHENRFSLIIMDDGLQNPSLCHDVKFCVVDAAYGFGNGRVFPSGPCRTLIKPALKRCDMILCIGQQMIPALADLNNIIQMDFEAHHDDIERFKEHDYIAFAGIGTPGKFFDTLSKYSIPVIDAIPFPDHHLYTDQDLQMLVERAKSQNARLMTTGKDAVKLAQYRDVIGQSLDVLSVSLKVEEQGWHQIDQMITDTLNHNFTGKPLRRDHKKR